MLIVSISTASTIITKGNNFNGQFTLSQEEQKELQKILLQITSDPSTFNEEVHNKFWDIFRKRSTDLEKTVLDFKNGFEKYSVPRYLQYYYRDACYSVKTKKAFKSSEVAEIEKIMLSNSPKAERTIKDNDANMDKIAKGEAITIGGESIVIDEENARKLAEFYKNMYDNFEKLFENPSQQTTR